MKKLLTSLLIGVLAIAVTFGAFGCDRNANSENNSGSSTVEDSSAGEQTPQVPMPEGLTLVERASFAQRLLLNVGEFTVGEVVTSVEDALLPTNALISGITVGDVAQVVLGESLIFGFYSDGNWYSGEAGTENFKVFNRVANALFNYEITSGKSLGLTDSELSMCGSNKVIGFLESQFDVKLEKRIVNACPTGGNLKKLVPQLLQLTVNDLCALMEGDLTFFEEYLTENEAVIASLENVDAGDIILEVKQFVKNITKKDRFNAFFDELAHLYEGASVLELENAFLETRVDTVIDLICRYTMEESMAKEVAEFLTGIFSGSVGSASVDSLLPVTTAIAEFKDIVLLFIDNPIIFVALDELCMLYDGATVAHITDGTFALKVDDVINSCANVALVAMPKKEGIINSTETLLKRLSRGTIGNFEIDSNLPAKEFINALRNVIDQFAKNKNLDNLYNQWLNEVGDISFMHLLNENKNTSMEQLLTEMFDVFELMLPRNAEKINAVEITFKSIFIGTLSAPGVKEEVFASELLNAIADLGEAMGFLPAEVEILRTLADTYQGIFLNNADSAILETKLKDIFCLFA